MKKIMFNDRYCLTQAVLEGRKTMTRRIIPPIEIDWNRRGKVTLPISCIKNGYLFMDTSSILNDLSEYIAPTKYQPKYNQGEVVAVAQCYEEALSPMDWVNRLINKDEPGWKNKMYVRAGLMPHQIRITNVRVERLQDISDEDCMREGVQCFDTLRGRKYFGGGQVVPEKYRERIAAGDVEVGGYETPQQAFAALIDKVSGKGTWVSNPWVFVYEFELVK